MHVIVEPPGVRRATGAMFVVFASVGVAATVGILMSGEGMPALLFGGMFIGVPWIVHRASVGPGIPGFTLSPDGILGAAEDEMGLIAWGDVDHLAWRGTGLEINDVPCMALHAVLADGRSVRITTYTARRGREVDEVVQQVRASGMLPERVGFGVREAGTADGRRGVPADGFSSAAQDVASATSWSDLPTGVKVFVFVFLALFFAPFLVLFAVIPALVTAFGAAVGWVAVAVGLVLLMLATRALARRGRTPVLACSFTVEGVVADHGDGLTIPWQDGVELRVESTVTNDGPLVDGGTGQGWVIRLHRPSATTVELSAPLTSRFAVQRAVGELIIAKRRKLIPGDIRLSLPLDLPPDVARKLTSQWDSAA